MPKSALEKAMDLLAMRPLSTGELRKKLSGYGSYSAEEISDVIETCCKRGYLNDGLLASDAAQYLNGCGKGRRMIRQKLRARGLGEEEVVRALDEISPEDEYAAAQSAAEGKLRLLVREKDPRKKREKLFRFLISRGFSPELTNKTVGELLRRSQDQKDEDFPEIMEETSESI